MASKMMTSVVYKLFLCIYFIGIFHQNTYASAVDIYSWDNIQPSLQPGRLNGQILSTLTDNRVHMLSFCVLTCAQTTACQSVNFLLGQVCELLNVTSDNTDFVIETPESNSTQETFIHVDIKDVNLDREPQFGRSNCGPNGIAFRSAAGDSPMCLCHYGWHVDDNCNQPVVTSWSGWSDWSGCSMSCGRGWRERGRRCETDDIDTDCPGESQEYGECHSPCGVWDPWSIWSDCVFTTHCGVAVKTRNRRCPLDELADNDNIGVNKSSQCRGFSEESLVCDVLSCDAPKRTYSGSNPGDEPMLQVLHKDQWFSICHDTFDDHAATITCLEMGKNGLDQFSPVPLTADNQHQVVKVWCKGTENKISECQQEIFDYADDGASIPCDNLVSLTCKADGYFELWGEWEECTISCGGGTQIRRRECVGTEYGGQMCVGIYDETMSCNEDPCPVDCIWLSWSPWSSCNVSCGGGFQSRLRNSSGPYHSGSPCIGESSEQQSCSPNPCPVDCVWLDWSPWSPCNVTCGGGYTERYRNSSGPSHGGNQCEGETTELDICSTNPCPVDCVRLEWSPWSPSNVTCAGGYTERYRNSSGPFHGGNQCEGETTEFDICSTNPCPVDCIWLEWSPWSPCNVTCAGGYTERYRNSSGPFHGGNQCEGETTEFDICSTNPCPVDGVWSDWSAWSGCSVTCGSGSLSRNRTCTGPFHGGLECVGSDVEHQDCSIQCSVQGDWTSWSDWTMCSVTCDGGTRSRSRNCSTTEPVGENQHVECDGGPSEETEACHEYSCLPLAVSCEEWKLKGLLDNTAVEVAPNFNKFWAFCNLDAIDGYVVTEIHHNTLGRQSVNGFESQGGFMLELVYNTSVENVISLVDKSFACRQFISWECFGASIKNPSAIGANTYWTDRFYEPKYYWGGASYESENCACGDAGTCVNPDTKCNCDANDDVLRRDEGYLDYKLDLPVTQFLAGDTGGETEFGSFRIGPIECYGTSDGESYYL